MTGRKRVGVDLDGVCYEWQRTARFMMNLYRGYDLPPIGEWWYHWDSLQERVSALDWDWLWSEGVEKYGLFRYGHVSKGAIEGIRVLSSMADVVIITARPKNAVNDTLAWLAYNQFPASEVHILSDGEPKSSVKECDVYLDDAPHNVGDLYARTSGLVLLWDRPWNRGQSEANPVARFTAARARRVYNWEEVVLAVSAR